MSKPPKQLEGRPATGARGDVVWNWVEGNEIVETAVVRALGDGLSLESSPDNPDPYSQAGSRPVHDAKGRTLDDMRRLNEELKLARVKPVEGPGKGAAGKSEAKLTRAVQLRMHDRNLVVDERKSRISIGRGETNDVLMMGDRISRVHARIEIKRNLIVLTDESANGTYVRAADGTESFVQGDSLPLAGQGMIGFGRRPREGSSRTICFSCDEA
jgi:hypothetical protein